MKKIAMLMVLVISSISIFAQYRTPQVGTYNNGNSNYGSTELTVSSNTNKQFTVSIDGRYNYTSNSSNGYGNSVNINNLYAGMHTITIYENRSTIFGKNRLVSIYNSSINLKQGYSTSIAIDMLGRVNIYEQQIYNNNNRNNGNYNNGNAYGKRKNKQRDHCNDDNDNRRYNNNYPRRRN
jgi:hypothetical protein